ncbi:MAG: outer membrane beta-barrel protein [Bdellovibrionales bacterium]|nr:outer membrane beta-barrel protein [Bdellovibrionales bacterium]
MKRISILTFATLALLGATQAQAGVHLEPGVGYHFGSTDSALTAADTYGGLGFDVRAGLSMEGFAFGPAFHYAMIKAGDADDGDSADTMMNLGAFAQYTIPGVGLTLRGQFDFMSNMASGNVDDRGTKGTAIRFGLGYNIIPKLAINVDYLIHNVTTSYVGDTETDIPDSYDLTVSSFFVSLSVPFGF